MRRIKVVLPRDEAGHLDTPILYPSYWRWYCRSPWWVGLPFAAVWVPIGIILHLLMFPLWLWDVVRSRW